MKKIKYIFAIVLVYFVAVGCDDEFEEVNTNPYQVTDVDPALLFAGAQRSHLGTWAAEHTIVQQFVTPYNTGANTGFNFNADIDGVSNPKWDGSYQGTLRNLIQALNILGEDTDRTNLRSMIRIWKAQIFMGLVDNYGYVPYFDAGKAVSESIFFPVYDSGEVVYEDLYNELKSATSALSASGEFVSEDLFYGSNGSNSTSSASAQVEKWKKLGNSLLLRLGMRYSKVNASKAQSIVSEAFAAGVMTSNADNAYVKYDGTAYVQNENNNLRNFSFFNYAAEPFVDFLKATDDPRGQYMIATYDDPGALANDPDPDTDLANQFGVPIGIEDNVLEDTSQGYRGPNGTGLNYSQINIFSVASPAAPDFYVTYAQTSLLLAEAAHRNWISGDAQTYYEDGIRADMNVYDLYPNTTPISNAEINEYLAEPLIAYNSADALELINYQYWVVNFRNGTEAFANWRRSNYPDLEPVDFTGELAGKHVRRLSYPDREGSANADNYSAAAAAMGGDVVTARVFWDVN